MKSFGNIMDSAMNCLCSCVYDAEKLWDPNRTDWDREAGVVSDSEFNRYMFKLQGMLEVFQLNVVMSDDYVNELMSGFSAFCHALDDGDEEAVKSGRDFLIHEFDGIAYDYACSVDH